MPSPLDFPSSEVFRKKLVVRNLVPYKKSPSAISPPINYETIQRDLAPTDSDDTLIDNPILANKLYPLNQYGADGGYTQVRDPGTLQNTNSNEGEYGYQDANILDEAAVAALQGIGTLSPAWKPLNAYANTTQLYDAGEFIGQLEILRTNNGRGTDAQPYPNFNPSTYRAVSLVLNPDPTGSNGPLSSDSYLAKLGATFYRKSFEYNVARQITQETRGRANFLNVNGGEDIFNLITGRVPLLEPNYNITTPSTIIGAAASALNRLSGTYAPFSTIPGSYFDPSINSRIPTTTQQLASAYGVQNLFAGIGRFFASIGGQPRTGSQLFLANTGAGQKSALFNNLDYNVFKPGYDRGILDRVAGALVGTFSNNSDYYVGSVKSEPSQIFSPVGDLPVDRFGREIQSPVYGPSELAQLYEGPGRALRLGANGPTYSSGGGIEGGFTWVSPKFRGNAGKYVGPGGKVIADDPDFAPSGYGPTESTNYEFRQGSILDETQRIIDSQPRSGGRRQQHAGNAIDQVSKVFNDGYKEITKGSKVIRYIGQPGAEVGAEYCRIFTKDTPYLQYNDLQKQDGMTTQNRRFSYSVLDSTYNLNIYPNKREGGQDSTNLINGVPPAGGDINGYAKKYMFSLENLAWRTSNRPGLSYGDLAVCERGPNGGRIMWFPPYNLKFSESTNASFQQTDFIGRPEPVFTYKNSNRSGSLNWSIIVDHPSIMNMIVNKVLSNENNKNRIDSIIESFFAGCRKYDIYELAARYYTINPEDLFEIQQRIQNQDITTEEIRYIKNTIQVGDASTSNGGTTGGGNTNTSPDTSQTGNQDNFEELINLGLYFDNDIPEPNQAVQNYENYYTTYVSSQSKQIYADTSLEPQKASVFFTNIVEANKVKIQEKLLLLNDRLTQYPQATAELVLRGTASSPASADYNRSLGQRRVDAAVQFIRTIGNLGRFIDEKKLTIVSTAPGEVAFVDPDGDGATYERQFCSTSADSSSRPVAVYSVNAMSCRRTAIENITVKIPPPPKLPPTIVPSSARYKEELTSVVDSRTVTQQVVTQETVFRNNITKRVLRGLLSECDYFEVIKEETPMVYDNLKEKLKFFHPAFHSITPEGLNSRLTFLQQCMRPGDTIPTTKVDKQGVSTLEYNNAVNTSFGAPPVLVLRVGDFYHSKIIPTNLNISYEGLDLNPEGIGVQPMVANITLSFNFVGGQGLQNAVDKLQNALSFNFYANTEVYDDRADATDTSYQVIDKQFLDDLDISIPPPTVQEVQTTQSSSNFDTIGNILTTETTSTSQTGTTEYKTFMNQFKTTTQGYFTNVVSRNTDLTRQYNNAVRQIFSLSRNYIKGPVLANSNQISRIFGKPSQIEFTVNQIFSNYLNDIQSGSDGFITFMSGQNYSPKVMRLIKRNTEDYVQSKKGSFANSITTILQGLTTSQEGLIQQLTRANTVPFVGSVPNTGTDGFQQANGNIIIFDVAGTTDVHPSSTAANTLLELNDDIVKIATDLNVFDEDVTTNFTFTQNGLSYSGLLVQEPTTNLNNFIVNVFTPFTSENITFTRPNDGDQFRNNISFWNNVANKRQYFILSKEATDQPTFETFKTAIIGNIKDIKEGNTDLSGPFDAYWTQIARPIFGKENEVTNAFINAISQEKLKTFLVYTPFSSEKKRVFTYVKDASPSNTRKILIKNLGLKNNTNTDVTTWASESANVITPKVQLL